MAEQVEQTVRALLFDTRSIQKYIFSGNRLKTNIGASYIVDQLFDQVLVKEILDKGKNTFGLTNIDSETWQKKAQSTVKGQSMEDLLKGCDCYVAYIGGGNALLLFSNDLKTDPRKDIVTAFTKKLLVEYPGLKTGSALGELDLSSEETFQSTLDAMYASLKVNQNTVFPEVNVPLPGLTLTCEVNGEAANFYDDRGLITRDGQPRFYSQEVRAKMAIADAANKALQDRFAEQLKIKHQKEGYIQDYQFPMEFEQLGQQETEADIAVIHIDGNQMGVRFNRCKNLAERSKLSYQVGKKTESAFASLLDLIVQEVESNQYAGLLKLTDNCLPIRPLILGGDDVTFVCPARVALHYAQHFMKALADGSDGIITVGNDKDDKYKGISSCAGIAILPTAYPFFRGYVLAEQACDVAKAASRKDAFTCWLDFVILHGEQAPELSQIRAEEYKGAQGNMHFGPYRVDDDDDEKSLQKLLACEAAFEKMPRNKVKELRFVAQQGEAEIATYVEQLQHQGLSLPKIPGWERFSEKVWDRKAGAKEGQTPYVDAVEIMDYVLPQTKEKE